MDASTTAPLVAALSDIGLRRKENQDSYGHFRGEGPAAAKGHLVVVADGMGGHQGGGVASRLAVATIRGTYRAAPAGATTRAHVVHVGDPRAYLIRDAQIKRLTSDQTWVQAMAAQGVITSR